MQHLRHNNPPPYPLGHQQSVDFHGDKKPSHFQIAAFVCELSASILPASCIACQQGGEMRRLLAVAFPNQKEISSLCFWLRARENSATQPPAASSRLHFCLKFYWLENPHLPPSKLALTVPSMEWLAKKNYGQTFTLKVAAHQVSECY